MTTTANVQAETNVTQLAPYIFLYGRCEEALEFYKSVLGGTYELMRVSEAPMADQWPAEARNKVMHATFKAPGIMFYASDGQEEKTVDADAGNVSVALNIPDRATADRVFAGLAQGGKISMPLEDAFWGGRFGMIQDRFGTEWMITAV